ncbi:MAG TPA: hypothetical protein VEH84_17935 [Alphaproteobacteria bacterium]|nr:hypothetical protein [Alphaproteobacteria bacterium]
MSVASVTQAAAAPPLPRIREAAGTPVAAEAASPQTDRNFISPYLQYDQAAHIVILQVRDTSTGEVRLQYPANRVVEDYKRQAEARLREERQALLGDKPGSREAAPGPEAKDGAPAVETTAAPAPRSDAAAAPDRAKAAPEPAAKPVSLSV